QVIGESSTGINARLPRIEPGQVVGYYIAMDPLTGQRKWEVPLTDMPSSAGTLVTGGGLVFTGKPTGEFVALDEDTGKTLWQFKTGSSVNATAITYTHKGRQYVSIASGMGGTLARRYVGQSADRRIAMDLCLDLRMTSLLSGDPIVSSYARALLAQTRPWRERSGELGGATPALFFPAMVHADPILSIARCPRMVFQTGLQ